MLATSARADLRFASISRSVRSRSQSPRRLCSGVANPGGQMLLNARPMCYMDASTFVEHGKIRQPARARVLLRLTSLLSGRLLDSETAEREYSARRLRCGSRVTRSGGSSHHQVEDPRSELRIPDRSSIHGQPAKHRGWSRREESRLWLRRHIHSAHQPGLAHEARGFSGRVWLLRPDRSQNPRHVGARNRGGNHRLSGRSQELACGRHHVL